MQLKEKNLRYKGTFLFYRITGKGKPVVLLHGFGEDGNIWKYQVDFLKDHFMLVVPDIPGSGKSAEISQQYSVGSQQSVAGSKKPAGKTKPQSIQDVSIDDYAACIKAILDKENITQCTMTGHSMGGYITLAFAEKYPQYLNGIGLFHSTVYADSEEKKTARRRGIEFIQQHGVYAFLQQAIPGLFGEKFKTKHHEEINALVEAAQQFTDASLIEYYTAMIQRPDRKAVLQQFVKPVLFIAGEEDKTVNLQDSLSQAHIPAVADIHIFPAVAHMGMWEEKDKTNTTLLNYLKFVNEN
jgi:pimeloyl-ACP methyl ester carboxylesterase